MYKSLYDQSALSYFTVHMADQHGPTYLAARQFIYLSEEDATHKYARSLFVAVTKPCLTM